MARFAQKGLASQAWRVLRKAPVAPCRGAWIETTANPQDLENPPKPKRSPSRTRSFLTNEQNSQNKPAPLVFFSCPVIVTISPPKSLSEGCGKLFFLHPRQKDGAAHRNNLKLKRVQSPLRGCPPSAFPLDIKPRRVPPGARGRAKDNIT